MGLMTRKLRREQMRNRHIRNLAENKQLATEYIAEASAKITHDATVHTTGRVMAMTMYALHKYWGFGKTRLLRFMDDMVAYADKMSRENISHDKVYQLLIDECGIDMDEAIKAARKRAFAGGGRNGLGKA